MITAGPTPTMHAPHRRLHWIAALLLLSLGIGIGSPALAQSSDALVADPIRLADLRLAISLRADAFAGPNDGARVGAPLGEDRWQKVEAAHDAYLESLKSLRSSLIDPAIERLRQAPPWYESPDSFRARRQEGARIAPRIADIEEKLFQAVEVALGEELRSAVDGARVQRALARAAQQDNMLTGFAVHMDLSERVLRASSLTREERTRLVERVRDLDRQQLELTRRIVSGLMERGERLTAKHHEDPIPPGGDSGSLWRAHFEEIRAQFPEVDESLAKLTELRRRFLTETLRGLPMDTRRHVRQELLNRKQLVADDQFGMERRFRAMLRSTKLDAAMKERVRELYRAWVEEDERLALATEIEALASGPRPQDRDADNALQADRNKIAERSLGRLRELLPDFRFGDEIEEVWRVDAFVATPAPADQTSLERRVASEVDDGNENLQRWRMNLSVRTPDAGLLFAWIADATPEERSVIETLFRDASVAWRDLLAGRLQNITRVERDAPSLRWQFRGEHKHRESVAAMRDGLRSLALTFDDADARTRELFASLRAALPPDRAEALACAEAERRLELWVDDESTLSIESSWEFELVPNLARVMRVAFDDDTLTSHRAALVPLLAAEGTAIVATARDRRIRLAQLAADGIDLLLRNAALDAEGAEGATPAGREPSPERTALDEERAAHPGKVVALRRTSADAMRAALARLTEPLPVADRPIVRLLYEREAYPELFLDRRDATPIAERAKALVAKDEARSNAIDALMATHRLKRAQQVIAFVDGIRANPAFGQPEPHELANRRRHREHFDRSELHTRLIFGLRRILTAEECRRIRSLNEYEALVARLGHWWWRE